MEAVRQIIHLLQDVICKHGGILRYSGCPRQRALKVESRGIILRAHLTSCGVPGPLSGWSIRDCDSGCVDERMVTTVQAADAQPLQGVQQDWFTSAVEWEHHPLT
jgi:hypothetical protein